MAGLMNQTDNKSNLLTAIRIAFGPSTGETQSLQQCIEALMQNQLQTVMTYAKKLQRITKGLGEEV